MDEYPWIGAMWGESIDKSQTGLHGWSGFQQSEDLLAVEQSKRGDHMVLVAFDFMTSPHCTW